MPGIFTERHGDIFGCSGGKLCVELADRYPADTGRFFLDVASPGDTGQWDALKAASKTAFEIMNDHKTEQRALRDHFRHWSSIPTRVNDNDFNNHVNNSIYYSYIDTLIVTYLIEFGGLRLDGNILPFCVENRCRFYRPLSFPEKVQGGLSVTKIGNSSVRYEIGLFSENATEAAAQGYFVHVFINAKTKEKTAIPAPLRNVLEKICVCPWPGK